MNAEADLVEEILTKLGERGIEIALESRGASELRLSLKLPGGRPRVYTLLVSRHPTPSTVHSAHTAIADGERTLLLAPYLTTTLAQGCRNLDVSFADAAGNAFIEWPGVLIDVEGKPRNPRFDPTNQSSGRRMFDPAGIKILFTLLTFPDLITQPYRKIAHASTVSLGATQMVLKELMHDGYLEPTARTLHRTRELYGKWLDAFLINLGPKLETGSYRVEEPGRLLRSELPEDVVWGGETAAAMLDGRLRPETLIIYTERRPTALLTTWKARRTDTDANVFVRDRFWVRNDYAPMAPSTLIHADLLASRDPRQAEAAQRLRRNDALLQRIDAG